MHNWVARYAGKAEGGTGCGLPNALLLQCNDADVYWRIKVGRPEWAKVPLLIKPHAALYLIDFSLVHPAYRHLRHREAFARLWEAPGAPLHVIAPLKQPLRFLHPAFQTSGEDLRRQAADAQTTGRLIGVSTASFFWMADRAWDAFATLLGLYGRARSFAGASSFNKHGEPPPFTFDELAAYLASLETAPCDLIITDETFERSGALSSHTQVRLPLVDEQPDLVVVRRGSISPEWLARSTGYPVHVPEGVSQAARGRGLTDVELQRSLEQLRPWRDA